MLICTGLSRIVEGIIIVRVSVFFMVESGSGSESISIRRREEVAMGINEKL